MAHQSRRLLLALTLVLASIALIGCAKPPPEQTIAVSNSNFSLDQLFTDHRGNTVYRFYDAGDYRYYVVGPTGVQMLPTTKTVTVTETDIRTEYVERDDKDHGHHRK